ncbi:MAG: polyprenol monophosphomannose synthase [Bacteroidia bacterium]|nr:polyprenol monophosphomannose synthase [Bacteroidia bacterium]
MSTNIVIIPTYNEKENAEAIIRKVMSLTPAFEVLIVDDNSPDGTADIVKSLQNEFKDRLHLLSRQEKNGLGTAYIAGFNWCLARTYKYIFEMDADFSHNPEDLIKLLHACESEGAGLAVGSRYLTGVNVVNWPMSRVIMSYYASVYVRFITGMTIRDATAGFVCYTRETLQAINLDKIKFKGYAFQIEMKFKAFLKGIKIQEVPIIFTDRTLGSSKMSKKIFREAFFGVIELKLKSLFSKNDA